MTAPKRPTRNPGALFLISALWTEQADAYMDRLEAELATAREGLREIMANTTYVNDPDGSSLLPQLMSVNQIARRIIKEAKQ